MIIECSYCGKEFKISDKCVSVERGTYKSLECPYCNADDIVGDEGDSAS